MRLVTPKALAERLDMSTSTLAKWRLDGAGPAYVKIGARVAYDEEMVEAWLASRVRKSTSDTGREAA
jgi:predicted DNA-binding transcriptional regulator AlpA